MKKTVIPVIALLICLSQVNFVQAQQKNNVVKVAPLSLIVLTGNLQYERMIKENMSLNLGAYYGGLGFDIRTQNTTQNYHFKWMGITPELRFYLLGHGAPDGLYIGPYLRFRRSTIEWNQEENDAFGDPFISHVKLRFLTAGFGGVVGYQALVGDVVTFDTYLGLGYNASFLKIKQNSGNSALNILDVIDFQGFAIRPGFTIGVAF
ncbi:MAG: DUF3575 domain-containing protein [Bacteroidia bacterium]|nr:DUF3575 domain-containing protein [Bacteroidia bacterium]